MKRVLSCYSGFGSGVSRLPGADERDPKSFPPHTPPYDPGRCSGSTECTGPGVTSNDHLVALYAQVIPGVVAISTGSSLGSGFVFDSNGHIVTNQHVIDGANGEVEVAFHSGYKAYGTVIGSDTDAEVAVIQVDPPADQIHPLVIGAEHAVKTCNPFFQEPHFI